MKHGKNIRIHAFDKETVLIAINKKDTIHKIEEQIGKSY